MGLVIKALKELKEKPGFDRLLKNLTIIDSFGTAAELDAAMKKEGVVPGRNNTHVFMFAPESQRDALGAVSTEVRSVYVDEKGKDGRIFDAAQYYYPLAEIVTITLVSFHHKYDCDRIKETIKAVGMNAEELNIADITAENAYLVFYLLPRIARYDHTRRDRVIRLADAIRTAA